MFICVNIRIHKIMNFTYIHGLGTLNLRKWRYFQYKSISIFKNMKLWIKRI